MQDFASGCHCIYRNGPKYVGYVLRIHELPGGGEGCSWYCVRGTS
jgi:hypothetical protein